MDTINVVLVGTNALFREGLRHLLDQSRFAVVGEARDLGAVEAFFEEGPTPHLVLAELNGCVEQSLDGLRDLHAAYEGLRIVVLANEFCLAEMARLLNAGADGYLVNQLTGEALSLSLLLVRLGEKVLPSTLAGVLANDSRHVDHRALLRSRRHLTEREEQILQCLLNAYSNKHIARALDISEGTVKVHLKSLMKKISASNRTQAALWAHNNGIDGRPFGNEHGAGERRLTA
ncbi:response regulator transcription factor [Geminicoccaceae bacterium 1502E]|nr:response regulator transcription factor [Geminicoccaceae bacterium 1502E]